jgi:hypothetical protein
MSDDDGVDALTGIVAAAANGMGQYVVGVAALFLTRGYMHSKSG